jgi:hypothetical protein
MQKHWENKLILSTIQNGMNTKSIIKPQLFSRTKSIGYSPVVNK